MSSFFSIIENLFLFIFYCSSFRMLVYLFRDCNNEMINCARDLRAYNYIQIMIDTILYISWNDPIIWEAYKCLLIQDWIAELNSITKSFVRPRYFFTNSFSSSYIYISLWWENRETRHRDPSGKQYHLDTYQSCFSLNNERNLRLCTLSLKTSLINRDIVHYPLFFLIKSKKKKETIFITRFDNL